MTEHKYKLGDILVRAWDLHPGNSNWRYKKGVKIQIVKITTCKYYYIYLDETNAKGNAIHDEIDSNCILDGKLGNILYA